MRGSKRSSASRRRLALWAAVVAGTLTLSACGGVPADTDGTLSRVQDGELRVGVTHNPPWTTTDGSEPSGTEVELVEQLAEQLGSEIAWTVSSEAALTESLHRGDLDLVIGGFTDDTPWVDKAAITAPYAEKRDRYGDLKKHVLLTRPGENQFLVAVETFLTQPESGS